MSDLLWFLVFGGLAVGLVRLLFHLRARPGSPFFPDALKHRWSVGILALAVPYIAFPLPYLLVGEVAAGLVAALVVTGVGLIFGGEILRGIRADLKGHRVHGRSLFAHSDACAVTEGTEGRSGDK